MRSRGPIHLARIAGIDLSLHWSWFLVALIEIQSRSGAYSSLGWNVAEYLSLFLIVTLHEFGHALACRQVGGHADHIILWPLGGIAFVDPPPRPGPTLWSLAAGPLVNVALAPLLWLAWNASTASFWMLTHPDALTFVHSLLYINLGLLIFNLIPVYPLDGGQILGALLWFPLGRGRSLLAATTIGIVGACLLGLAALLTRDLWLGVIDAFILLSCWGGLRHARALGKLAKLPRQPGFLCPSCGVAPPAGTLWNCPTCRQPFDFFAASGACPACGAAFARSRCFDCGHDHSLAEWASHASPTTPARLAPSLPS
ncbi:MAG TPA: site-2 protease family protein [Terriglobales bacterium]|nr:site-2 protease family protein [Terriglobales bacterium]